MLGKTKQPVSKDISTLSYCSNKKDNQIIEKSKSIKVHGTKISYFLLVRKYSQFILGKGIYRFIRLWIYC